jgi:hypothetical protein
MISKNDQALNIKIKANNLIIAMELTTKELYSRANEIEADLTEIMCGADHPQKIFYCQTWIDIQRLKQKLQLFTRDGILSI